MGISVQFKGVDDVVNAFDLRGDGFWAVFQAKAMPARGEGPEELRANLELLRKHGSAAIYTLKVYDDVSDVKQIREKTECSGSFNFTLLDDGARSVGDYEYRLKLEERIKLLEDGGGDSDDDEGETVMGKIGKSLLGLLSEPDKLIQVINGFRSMVVMPQGPQMIGNVIREFTKPEIVKEKTVPIMNEDIQAVAGPDQRYERLSAAIDILEKNDPLIVEHLEKLAQISKDNKPMFKMLTSNLDNF